MNTYKLGAAMSAVMLLGAPTLAQAQESASVGDIVVTAERRETRLQDTPIAVTALSGESLEDRSVTNVEALSEVAPGLSFNKVSNFIQLSIRGISLEQINLGGEPGVAFHMDGVYVARPFAADAVFADLERVEVLRGPQGTLYGRNATGGSVNLIPNEPSDRFEGRAGITLGDYDRLRTELLVNGPLTAAGGVQARASFVSDRHDGYTENLLDGRDVNDANAYSGRVSLGIDPNESVRFVLSLDYTKVDEAGPIFDVGSIAGTANALGGRITADPRTIYIDGPSAHDFTGWGATGRLTWDLGGVTLTSITGYRDSEFSLQSDLDGTDFFLVNEALNESGEQWSQEFQLTSNGDGPFSWLIGLYAFHEDGVLDYDFPIPLLGTTISFDATQETKSYAIFGQASYQFTPRLRGTLGLRQSYEEKSGDITQVFFTTGSVSLGNDWQAFTPRFVLDYRVSDDAMIYASIARGFKGGGINTGSLQTLTYDPEYVWSGEIGLKSRWFDNRLQANLAAFYYEYSDLQVNQFAVGQTFIVNAASATGRGLEAEFLARPSDNLTIDASLVFLDATFDEFSTLDTFRPGLGVLNLAGNELPRSPNFTAHLGAEYRWPLANGAAVTLRGDYTHRSDYYFTPFNTDYARSPATDLFNARLAYESGDWLLALFGRNLTDELTIQTTTVSGINAGTIELYGPPRTWGVELRRAF